MEKENIIKLIEEKFNDFKIKDKMLLNLLNQKSIPKMKNQIINYLRKLDFKVTDIGNNIYGKDKGGAFTIISLIFVNSRNIDYKISNFQSECFLHVEDKIDNEIYRKFDVSIFNPFISEITLNFNWKENSINELQKILQVLTENVECINKRLDRLKDIDVNEIEIKYYWDNVAKEYDNFMDVYTDNIKYFLGL